MEPEEQIVVIYFISPLGPGLSLKKEGLRKALFPYPAYEGLAFHDSSGFGSVLGSQFVCWMHRTCLESCSLEPRRSDEPEQHLGALSRGSPIGRASLIDGQTLSWQGSFNERVLQVVAQILDWSSRKLRVSP